MSMLARVIIEEPTGLFQVLQPVVKVLRVGTPGPPGLNGTGLLVLHEETFLVTADQTVFVLSQPPITGSVTMFVNGLRQGQSNFSLTVSTLTVTGFVPTTDDEVTFTYQTEV